MADQINYPSLDGLRGVAAFMVVFAHASNANMHVIPGIDLSGVGRMGVWLFFVLSAFLLTDQALAAFENKRVKYWLPYYALARIARIYPLFLLAMMVDVMLGRLTVREMLLATTLVEAPGIYWTIVPEFQFYFIIPLLAWGAAVRPVAGSLVVAAVGLASLGMPPVLAAVPYLSVFTAGTLSAVAFRRFPKLARSVSYFAPISLIVVLACVPSLMQFILPHNPYGPRNWHAIFGLIWAPVILACTLNSNWLTVLAIPTARFLGRISFGVYLLHPLAVAAFGKFAQGSLWGGGAVVVASVAIGWLALVTIELPARAWLTARLAVA